jgi:hypothetical protein
MRKIILFGMYGLLVPLAPLFGQQAKTGVEVVPSTAFAFVSVRVSDLRDMEVLKPVRDAIAKFEKSEAAIEKQLGVRIDEIDRLTLLWPTVPTSDMSLAPYIVVTTKDNYNEAKVLKALQAMPASGAKSRKHAAYGAGASAPPASAKSIEPSNAIPVPAKSPAGAGAPIPPPTPPQPPKDLPKQGAQVADPPLVPRSPARVEPAGDDAPSDGPELFFRERGPYMAVYLLDNRTLLHVPQIERNPESVFNLLGQLLRRKADGPLAEPLAEAGKHTIVAAARIQPIEEMIRLEGDLPRELVPYRSLLKAKTAVITVDAAAKTTVIARLRFGDAGAARRAEPVLKTLIQNGVDWLSEIRKDVTKNTEWAAVMLPLLDLASNALDKAEVKTDGAIVSVHVDAEIGPAVTKAMAALPDLIEIASTKQKTMNNLKQIGIACLNYHDTFGYMPQNIVGPDGKVLFSWRVAILPFIEQDNMFRQLNMTKPWDDPANAKILANMPAVFQVSGREAEKGKTHLQMPYSPQIVPGGSPFLVPGRRTSFNNITDGTSNTIMVVEAADAVSWAKPDDLLFDPKKAPKVGDSSRKWFYALFGDCSVRTLRRDKLTDDQLRALMTIDGGEVVEIPD